MEEYAKTQKSNCGGVGYIPSRQNCRKYSGGVYLPIQHTLTPPVLLFSDFAGMNIVKNTLLHTGVSRILPVEKC